MRYLQLVLAVVLIVSSGSAQTVPDGTGVLLFKEKLKLGGGCDSFHGQSNLVFTVNSDGTWLAEKPSGDYGGTMAPADARGRKWNLSFDSASIALYESYLESAASDLCGTPVTILGGSIGRFQARFKKDLSAVAIQLKTSATGATAFGTGKGRHAIAAKGAFAPGP